MSGNRAMLRRIGRWLVGTVLAMEVLNLVAGNCFLKLALLPLAFLGTNAVRADLASGAESPIR